MDVDWVNCYSCGRGFHVECLNGCDVCHPSNSVSEVSTPVLEVTEGTVQIKARKHGATAEGLKDPKSTGRKRAAELYPINESEPCEWRGKKNCGGGKRPLIGCVNGLQKHRHHGPVKDTTRNHEGNVHRICTACHNHWHELNDLIYEERAYGLLPHDPIEATVEELVTNAIAWQSGEMKKRYELASSRKDNGRDD